MGSLRFAWDDRKDTVNRRKHGIPFAEAETVFYDDRALLIDDPEHSETEDRFVLLGMSAALRVLLVCHCYREADDLIRIISARRANSLEVGVYHERWRT
ncbi:MAG: BrnT family toxin [Ardenticatenia bacterium]|jgi:uncharacterized DUF497 family protein|nr:BrnT family toxin [Ardenticatenia bacterium]MBK8540505.1 BrnT family toxin [Ardenticatenia bacterium]HRA21447.1 BrnT family toxin [Anaerolineae bacterium]